MGFRYLETVQCDLVLSLSFHADIEVVAEEWVVKMAQSDAGCRSFMILFKAIDLWKSVPQNLKDLNVYTFSKNIEKFLTLKAIFKETYLLKLSIIS